jgi:hypothetical protein
MLANKKGQANGSIWALVGLVMALGVVGIILAIIVYVLSVLGTTSGFATYFDVARNETVIPNASRGLYAALNAILQIPGWLPIIVVVLLSAIIIAMVMAAFAFMKTRD